MGIAGLVGMAALAASLQAGSRGAVHKSPGVAPDVTIYLENADAMFNLLTKSLVNHMFQSAGVTIAWSAGKPRQDPEGGLAVTIRLTDAVGCDRQRCVMGRTSPFGSGVRHIDVFEDNVKARASASQIDEYKVMAHVLVHEIGHLLERVDHHSAAGIMKASWSRDDYRTMVHQPLTFADEDLELIHRSLAEMRAHRPNAVEKYD
jgi:hypothetical protein